MTMYKYYAVIEKEKADGSGCYIVSFPDIENCFTDAESLSNAVVYAEDALGNLLSVLEEKGKTIPSPSPLDQLKAKLGDGASLVLIEVNTDNFKEAV